MAANHPKLAIHLLELFARGHLSGTQVQGIAHAAFQDGWAMHNQLSSRLAGAGSEGSIKGHVVRDIVRAARLAGLMSSGANPYKVFSPNDPRPVVVFLPHEVYQSMTEISELSQWCLTKEKLDQPEGLGPLLKAWAAEPDVNNEDDLTEIGMLGMHCDGVAYTTTMRAGGSKGVLAASINVISADTDKRKNRRQPLFVLRKSRLCQ